MSDYQPAPEGKDPVLWEIAQKRASFKKHLTSYVIVNGFLWALWFFTSSHYESFRINDINTWEHFPWPIWPALGWGIGLAFHYSDAYLFPKANSVEREYDKLKNKK
ncbi:MAG: 2TM domain-containing protein [Ferruginibacter sp.]